MNTTCTKEPKSPEKGFTLLELLVSLVIVGILTATAIPQYKRFRQQAYDNRALSDLRTVALAEESYFLDTEKYLSCSNNSCESLPGISTISRGTTIQITASEESFAGESSHDRGTGRIFRWSSSAGGLQP